jgi:hypothetical protein
MRQCGILCIQGEYRDGERGAGEEKATKEE